MDGIGLDGKPRRSPFALQRVSDTRTFPPEAERVEEFTVKLPEDVQHLRVKASLRYWITPDSPQVLMSEGVLPVTLPAP